MTTGPKINNIISSSERSVTSWSLPPTSTHSRSEYKRLDLFMWGDAWINSTADNDALRVGGIVCRCREIHWCLLEGGLDTWGHLGIGMTAGHDRHQWPTAVSICHVTRTLRFDLPRHNRKTQRKRWKHNKYHHYAHNDTTTPRQMDEQRGGWE